MSKVFVIKTACIAVLILICSNVAAHNAITSYSRNDPDPVFTTLDPHYFLNTYEKDRLKGIESIKEKKERICFSLTPFGQHATCARPQFEMSCAAATSTSSTSNTIEIGDIGGKWGMIPLVFGAIPDGQSFPESLLAVRNTLFDVSDATEVIERPAAIDSNKLFGYFSIPINYRKHGVRAELSALVINDIGLNVKVGLAEIVQAVQFNNLTTGTTTEAEDTNNLLMNNIQTIAQEIGLDIQNFHKASIEDTHLQAFWRHAFPMNLQRKNKACFEQFLLIPFLSVEGSLPAGEERPRNAPFAVSFGSNDHPALGFTTGIDLDFTETIEFGASAGMTHFFPRCFSHFPVPTSNSQSGIFPFQTAVHVAPGNNYHFNAWMSAYHFIGCLSFNFEYKYIKHVTDCLSLVKADPAFKPELLEKTSRWTRQIANIGFNYDISPFISLGVACQIPLSERAAYQSSSALISFNVMY